MHQATGPQRKGYAYRSVAFSEDGRKAWLDGCEYREVPFPADKGKRFNYIIVAIIVAVFAGIPLLAQYQLELFQRHYLAGFAALAIGLAWFNRRIHRCHRCNRATREITTPYDGAPVLFFCRRCRVFFEHGQIDGGWPWH
ncbi:hypothetical protein [Methylogaea oryzae]|uniref:Uncharacterized protein n=1 Tax=Methylogaea oryzae TaxID=1295382 RepID=A0A8D5AL66_9GAMM|nr:hypothetical protein [Methylogaea oryzae]BBL69855.1 hypothetical protein MoryE10_04610 [Methylogaea oryzae]